MVVMNSTEARRYIGPHATGLGYLVWKASEQVHRAFEALNGSVDSLQRLSAASYIARQAIEENIGQGTTRFVATYQIIHHSAGNAPDSEYLITVRVWVDAEAVATRAQVDHVIPGILPSVVIAGVPVEHLEFRIVGGWRGGGIEMAMGWTPGDITDELEGLWRPSF